MTDSLIVGESIELIGSVASANPLCTGAVFLLQPGYDLGAPQPVTSIVGSLLLDGSRPFGYQASNRTITLPIEISVPGDSGTPAGFQTLTAAREVLLREINQQTWTLRWTRDPGPGGTPLPLLFDCFRAHATVVSWGGVDQLNRFPIGLLTISFDAMPYARNDVPVIVDFPSPLAGRTAPPASVNIDTFSSVSGAQWAASTLSPVAGGQSAFWDPGIAPDNIPDGTGQAAVYTKSSLALNLSAGWAPVCNATGTTTTFIISTASANTAAIDVGDQFQLWTSAPALIQTQIFTVTKISQPSGGNVTVTYTPASAAAPVSTNSAIQTGPPNLPAVTFWAGFGSTQFYQRWARLGGRVQFAFSLTDTYSTTLGFSKTVKCTGSNNSLAPRWNKIRIPVPYQAGFDYANVASYQVTVTNRGTAINQDLRYTQLYLSALQAVAPPVPAQSPARGTVYELAGLPGTARAPVSLQFQQSGSKAYVQQLTVQGAGQQWTCPPGVSSVAVFCIGGGGAGAVFGGNAGGGGGGGGSAANAAVAVTAGNKYSFTVGGGGFTLGSAGTASHFTGDSVTVTANGGSGGTVSAGGAGGAAGTGGFAGGTGGAGVASGSGGGGAGGGSGGTAAGGNNGGAGSGGTGGVPGAAVSGGGNGGRGGTFNVGNGLPPTTGYGGGGGGSPGGASGSTTGRGAGGLVQLTYTATLPAFQTLIAHRPPPDAPHTLIPFVSPSPADATAGTIQYPVQSLVEGFPARFGGTYTVVWVAWSWHTTTARTLTVTVTQNEQAGGASYTSSVSASVTPSTLPVCSGTNANFGPLVVLGEMTLPVNDIPQDNQNAYFTVATTSTDTADQVQDILFLDTTGSTVLIQSPTAYANMYIDEPASDRDIGLIMGSLFDRQDAVSILDRATVAGGPMSVDPDGNPLLLAYAAEGAPNVQMTFHPRWYLDRIT